MSNKARVLVGVTGSVATIKLSLLVQQLQEFAEVCFLFFLFFICFFFFFPFLASFIFIKE